MIYKRIKGAQLEMMLVQVLSFVRSNEFAPSEFIRMLIAFIRARFHCAPLRNDAAKS